MEDDPGRVDDAPQARARSRFEAAPHAIEDLVVGRYGAAVGRRAPDVAEDRARRLDHVLAAIAGGERRPTRGLQEPLHGRDRAAGVRHRSRHPRIVPDRPPVRQGTALVGRRTP